MKSKELIKKLLELDPNGELDVVFFSDEDGFIYDTNPNPYLANAEQGIIFLNKEPNCIVI